MLRSQLFAPSRRDRRGDESSISARYLERMGYTCALGSGMVNHLPLGHSVFNNVKAVLNGHLARRAGCSFFETAAIQPAAVWAQSGRLELFGKGIFRFPDRHGREIVLAPTHEVTAAAIAARYLKSYRDLPVRISQIQVKFRDEERPRAGVIRSRQFQMHDAYAFDRDLAEAEVGYAMIREAYLDTFFDLRLPVIPNLQADMGAIGGDRSEEFLMPCASGDDRWTDEEGGTHNCLELAHIFLLGTGYSEAAGASYADARGARRPIYMSSFGLGIERAAAAFIERYANPDAEVEVSWSWNLSPFQLLLLTDGPAMREIYGRLRAAGLRVLLDDRDLPFRQKLGEGRQMGFPIEVLQGTRHAADEVEITCHRTGQCLRAGLGDFDEVLAMVRDRLEAVEIAERFGRVLSIDDGDRSLVLRLDSPWMLDHVRLEEGRVPVDLLGCFGKRKRWGEERLHAGAYAVSVVVPGGASGPEVSTRGASRYVTWPDGEPIDPAAVRRTLGEGREFTREGAR